MKILLSALILLTIPVSSGYAQDTVQVKTGWNIIGSVKAGAIPDVLSTFPDSIITSSFFGYDPDTGYQSTDTLGMGFGYWVKVIADGVIIFNTTPPLDSCKSKAFIYQGKLYNTVKIGNQCWMAENLDAGTMVTGATNQTDNDTLEKYCYNDSLINCTLYGGLYQWYEAMQSATSEGVQGICPSGWHLPTRAEFQVLTTTVGGDANALKAVGQGAGAGLGRNPSGFSLLLTGERGPGGGFMNPGADGMLWSSTSTDFLNMNADAVNVVEYSDDINFFMYFRAYGFSVRCLED